MYRWVDHTGEVELEIEAGSEVEVFGDALGALAELLGVQEQGDERRTLTVSGADRAALLAAWLEELVFLAESEGFVATRLEEFGLAMDGLSATVRGRLAAPPPLVKAVTYHRLQF